MKTILLHLRGVLIAVVALALSAGLVFAAHAPAASFGANTVSTQSAGDEASDEGDEDAEVDENANEDVDGDETTGETTDETAGTETVEAAGDNCLTDPTGLTPEELAAMNHGSIVCWAAHQTTWPEEFRNHGAWVSSWAHMGKGAEVVNGTPAVNAKATVKTHKAKVHKPKA